MTRKTLITLAAALAGAAATFATLPASAQEAGLWAERFAQVCDADHDGMVTKKEFLDRMAAHWDRQHTGMMKADGMMKAGMMSKAQFMAFARSLTDPGAIGGN